MITISLANAIFVICLLVGGGLRAHAYPGPWRILADRLPPGLGSLTIGELLNRYDHPPQPQA